MSPDAYIMKAWSLEDLYPGFDSPELQAGEARLEEETTNFEAHRADLSEEIGAGSLLGILESYEYLYRILSRLMAFKRLKYTEDTQDSQAQANMAQAQQLVAEIANRTLFFNLWWQGLDDPLAESLMAGAGDYKYWLEAQRLHKPYTLSEPEEKVINLKDVNGSGALVALYTTITNRYVYRITVDGEQKELTRDGLQVYFKDPDPDLREQAYKELLSVYEDDTPILGMIYQYLVRDWGSESVDLRRYASPMAMRNLANNIPDEVVDIMLEACRTNAQLFQRYFRLKARWLGMERIRRYDLYAPVVEGQKEIPFTEGAHLVLDSFRAFDDRMAALAE